jgi:hypothetical protein
MTDTFTMDKNIFIYMLGMLRQIDKKYSEDLANYYLNQEDITFKK